jgi:hypothetical protein
MQTLECVKYLFLTCPWSQLHFRRFVIDGFVEVFVILNLRIGEKKCQRENPIKGTLNTRYSQYPFEFCGALLHQFSFLLYHSGRSGLA